MKIGSAAGVISEFGVSKGSPDRFSLSMLPFERALTIIITITTYIITIAVIEAVVVAAVLMMVAAVVVDALAVVVQTVDEIDPADPVNMPSLFAFECTQEAPQRV